MAVIYFHVLLLTWSAVARSPNNYLVRGPLFRGTSLAAFDVVFKVTFKRPLMSESLAFAEGIFEP